MKDLDTITYEEIIELERKRQNDNIELIASENFPSQRVLDAAGSILTNKYAEGYPEKTVWLWTGYKYEDILDREDNHNILNYIDVLVDGQFEIDKKDITLKYCGSSNQRVIDVQKSLKKNKIILYEKR